MISVSNSASATRRAGLASPFNLSFAYVLEAKRGRGMELHA
jgi:hypothetical protein